jgi:branched-chain amino acid transport system ATP-binding protein
VGAYQEFGTPVAMGILVAVEQVEMQENKQTPKVKVKNMSLSFGGVRVLTDIDLEIKENELLAVIGPNGSGKTCLLNCISGFYKPQKGNINYREKDLVKLPPYSITKLGIGRTFQNLELFIGLSAVDNIRAARHLFLKSGLISGALYFGRGQREEIKQMKIVEEIIDFLEMESIRNNVVGDLPYGLRKRVELGRALALEPDVLLVDEPMAGMNLEEKEDLTRFLLDIYEGTEFGYESEFLRKGVKSVVLVEHDMGVVMDIADRVVVFDFGHKIADDTPQNIKGNDRVIKAYLGQMD